MNKEYQQEYQSLGLNIAFYRRKSGLTQLQLAERLNIDRSHMSAIELGNVGVSLGVSLDVLFALCRVLCVRPAELFDFR